MSSHCQTGSVTVAGLSDLKAEGMCLLELQSACHSCVPELFQAFSKRLQEHPALVTLAPQNIRTANDNNSQVTSTTAHTEQKQSEKKRWKLSWPFCKSLRLYFRPATRCPYVSNQALNKFERNLWVQGFRLRRMPSMVGLATLAVGRHASPRGSK